MTEDQEVYRLEPVSPPWYLSVLIGVGLAFAYTLSALTWLWWKTGEYAYRFAREMREAVWTRHQAINGWLPPEVERTPEKEAKPWEH